MTFSWYFPCFAPKYTLFFSTTFSWKPLRFHQCNVRRNLAAVFSPRFRRRLCRSQGDLATDYCLDWWTIFHDPGHMRSLKTILRKYWKKGRKGQQTLLKISISWLNLKISMSKKNMYILSLRLRLRRFFSVWNLSHVESFWTHLHSMTTFEAGLRGYFRPCKFHY